MGKEESAKSKGKSQFMIFVWIGIAALAVILYFIFRRGRSRRSPLIPIPYIFSRSFLKTLEDYVEKTSPSQVLAVLGPYGSGKTRGTREFADRLRMNQVLVFELDYTRLTSDDAVPYELQRTIEQGLALFANQLNNTVNLGIPDTRIKIANYSRTILQGSLETSEAHFKFFFDFINTIAQTTKTVLIINEPQSGYTNSFMDFCSSYTHNDKEIYTIATISDPTHINLMEQKAAFRFYFMDEFDSETAKRIFIDEEHVFTKKEFLSIWKQIGGYGLHWAILHDNLIENKKPAQSITDLQRSVVSQVLRVSQDGSTPQIQRARTKAIKKLSKHGSVELDDIIAPFVSSGICKLSSFETVVFSNKIAQTITKQTLKQFSL